MTTPWDRSVRASMLLLLPIIFLPFSLPQESGSGGLEVGGQDCLTCSAQIEAECIVEEANCTITCSANVDSCGYSSCSDTKQGCFLRFSTLENGTWIFETECFHPDRQEEECHLRRTYRLSTAFPPSSVQCLCHGKNCSSLNTPLVYRHEPSTACADTRNTVISSLYSSAVLSTLLPSPSVTQPPDHSSSLSVYLWAVLGVLGVLIPAVLVGMVVLIVCVIAKRSKSRPSRRAGSTGLQNLSDEQDLPFQLVHLISRGRFGYVYRTKYEGDLVAVKIFTYQNRLSWENEQSLLLMDSTKHRNVIEYIDSGSRGSGYRLQMFIVTPFYPLGSLNRFLERNTVSWEQACRVIHSIANGLGHLHCESYVSSGGIVMDKYAVSHRDVKSANVLVRGENGDCVIADLGFALILDPARDAKDMANTGQVGTYRYMAPEVLDARVNLHDIQSFKQIDMYALALVMWEVLWRCNVQEEESPRNYMMAYEDSVGQRPGIDSMREVVCTQKQRPLIPTSWRNHPGLSVLIDTTEECWDKDPEARLSSANVALRLKEVLDGGPTALNRVSSDHTPMYIYTHPTVAPGDEIFRRHEVQESTADTIGTTDSRPPPYDIRWGYAANNSSNSINNGGSPSGTMELNFTESTV